MRKIILAANILIITLLVSSGVNAAGTTGAEFLRLEVPAAAAAVGAGTAVQEGSMTLGWNPAGILGAEEPMVAFTHVASFVDTAYEQLEGVYPGWLGGHWAGRFFYATTYDFVEVNEYGEEIGALENYDLLLQLVHARSLGYGVSCGVGVKLFESMLAGFTSQGVALDVGGNWGIPGVPVTLGLAVQNVGGMTAYESEADPLPTMLFAGAATQWSPMQGHSMSLRVDVRQPLQGDEMTEFVLGLEYRLGKLIRLRAGYRLLDELGSLSVGAGVRYEDLGLDYAYQPFNGLGDNHRFTLVYYIPYPKPVAPRVRDLANHDNDGEVQTQAVRLKSANRTQGNVKSLTVLPRQYEGKIAYKVPKIDPHIKKWQFEIRDNDGQLIRKYHGGRPVPSMIQWDGKNQTGSLVPQAQQYAFAFFAEGKPVGKQCIPQIKPTMKLQFEDGSDLEPAVRFEFDRVPETTCWRLVIRRKSDRAQVRTLEGTGALPPEVLWDGKNENGTIADSRVEYAYDLSVAFKDQSELVVSEDIQAIPARQVPAPENKAGILIYGILFDFNSALLEPVMTDKCMAAAEIIRRHTNTAEAVCEGHADDIGTEAANLQISKERAHMVANFLARQPYVNQDCLALRGFGKSKPENNLFTEEGRSRNRRVEIRLFIPSDQ